MPGSFTLTGNTATTGTYGNVRTFTATNSVQVKASAFSRSTRRRVDDSVPRVVLGGPRGDRTGGGGSDPSHKVDNVGSVDYVLFEFSSPVVVDQAFWIRSATDSDITVWIGTKTDPFNNHLTLSDSFLSSLGFTEENPTTSSAARWADINAGGVEGQHAGDRGAKTDETGTISSRSPR